MTWIGSDTPPTLDDLMGQVFFTPTIQFGMALEPIQMEPVEVKFNGYSYEGINVQFEVIRGPTVDDFIIPPHFLPELIGGEGDHADNADNFFRDHPIFPKDHFLKETVCTWRFLGDLPAIKGPWDSQYFETLEQSQVARCGLCEVLLPTPPDYLCFGCRNGTKG